ncbi:MAG: aminotransferase class V-fold PLP-dependent enzyme [Pseudomonadota bacterium]
MKYARWSPLHDVPRFPADRFAELADRLARLLDTSSDVLLIQAEAVLALEAVALGLARPGLVALNIETSFYGDWFGRWLQRGGATVYRLAAEPGRPISLDAVAKAISMLASLDIVSVVHGEGANGVVNPLSDIARLARERNALVVVDAVASVGAHHLSVDAEGLDVAVIGPQKALGGPAGISAVSVSRAAWQRFEAPGGLTTSSLSVLDLKREWLDRGRGAIPGTPVDLEFWALDAALDRVEAEGLETLIDRHHRAARATRRGLRALGVTPWIEDDSAASALLTAAPVPAEIDAAQLVQLARRLDDGVSAGGPGVADRLVRLNHTGPRAQFSSVLATLLAYGTALKALGLPVSPGAAAEAVAAIYSSAT